MSEPKTKVTISINLPVDPVEREKVITKLKDIKSLKDSLDQDFKIEKIHLTGFVNSV